MTLNLPNREAYPVVLENPAKIGVYRHNDDAVDFFNMFDDVSILVGEPIIVYNRIGITKVIVLPSTCGTVNFNWVADFLVDPAHVQDILFGDKLYYSITLADSASPGYITKTQPTDGFFIGYAVCPHNSPTEIQLDSQTGKPICWKQGTNQTRVRVIPHNQFMVWGTNFFGSVPDYINGDTVISS